MIDGAWGVKAAKHKKKTADSGPPPPEDPNSIQNLSLAPIGQDVKRLRYWVIDGPCTLCLFHPFLAAPLFLHLIVFILPHVPLAHTKPHQILHEFIGPRIPGRFRQSSKALPPVGMIMWLWLSDSRTRHQHIQLDRDEHAWNIITSSSSNVWKGVWMLLTATSM